MKAIIKMAFNRIDKTAMAGIGIKGYPHLTGPE